MYEWKFKLRVDCLTIFLQARFFSILDISRDGENLRRSWFYYRKTFNEKKYVTVNFWEKENRKIFFVFFFTASVQFSNVFRQIRARRFFSFSPPSSFFCHKDIEVFFF